MEGTKREIKGNGRGYRKEMNKNWKNLIRHREPVNEPTTPNAGYSIAVNVLFFGNSMKVNNLLAKFKIN